MTVRFPDLRSRLSACVEGALRRPFEWGDHDCALFAADAVLAMTGEDLADGWRCRYCTPLGATRLLRRAGHHHVSLAFGLLPEVTTARAAMGDVVMIEAPDGPALGILLGALVAVPGEAGLRFMPRHEALRAFHVPFAGEAV